jgi:hypothetical protein
MPQFELVPVTDAVEFAALDRRCSAAKPGKKKGRASRRIGRNNHAERTARVDRKEGAMVDERFNGGGSLADQVISP